MSTIDNKLERLRRNESPRAEIDQTYSVTARKRNGASELMLNDACQELFQFVNYRGAIPASDEIRREVLKRTAKIRDAQHMNHKQNGTPRMERQGTYEQLGATNLMKSLKNTGNKTMRHAIATDLPPSVHVRSSPTANALLSALPPQDRISLAGMMERVHLRQGQVLSEPDGVIHHAFFPEQSVIYLVNELADGKSVEVGVVGKHALLGIPLALGTRRSFHRAIVQVGGTAIRMDADNFLEQLDRRGNFRRIMLDYAWRSLLVTCQAVACNRVHLLKQRLARLLLTLDDHVERQIFSMTHEFMSQMLGSARPEVAKAAASFRQAGYIEYLRGKVRVTNRSGLQSVVCACYSAMAVHLETGVLERKLSISDAAG